MSSWAKASKTGQKFHKERGQIKNREFLGLLEKKKDYKLRALDYQRKREQIKNVKRKIQERNPDEFYFNMVNTKLEDGMHQLKNKYQQFTEDEIKLMKSQDKNYIRMHQQIERKKIEKMQSSLNLVDSANKDSQNKHRFYADDREEIKAFDPLKQFNTDEKMLMNKVNRMTVEQCKKIMEKNPDLFEKDFVRGMLKRREKKSKELETRIKREKSLRKLEDNYDLKLPNVNPEDEYDERFDIARDISNGTAKQYAKVTPRKR